MRCLIALLLCLIAAPARPAEPDPPWAETLAQARGQTVYWHAWAGDEKVNAFIAWTAAVMRER